MKQSSNESDDNTPRVEGFTNFVEIGRGGASVVYSARQLGLDREVAIKVLNVDLGDDRARLRFERECAVLGRLDDVPGIVPVYSSAFAADGRGCIVMRLMAEPLSELLAREGPLSADRVSAIGQVAARALMIAHSRGIVHRDVKPANLLVSSFGEVALADFDIASLGEVVANTRTAESLSPPHAAPERLAGDIESGALGDIWSLGSTLFTLLEGAPPFGTARSSGGMAGLIDRVRNDPMPSLNQPDPTGVLAEVIARALQKDPAERWQSAAAMFETLGGRVEEAPETALDESAGSPAPHLLPGADIDSGDATQQRSVTFDAGPANPVGLRHAAMQAESQAQNAAMSGALDGPKRGLTTALVIGLVIIMVLLGLWMGLG